MATCFGYISHPQAIIYNHLFDLDIECYRALRENIQYLSQISDFNNGLKMANIAETCSH
jgi:hypothetical protein